jgi:hypothetical protein
MEARRDAVDRPDEPDRGQPLGAYPAERPGEPGLPQAGSPAATEISVLSAEHLLVLARQRVVQGQPQPGAGPQVR